MTRQPPYPSVAHRNALGLDLDAEFPLFNQIPVEAGIHVPEGAEDVGAFLGPPRATPSDPQIDGPRALVFLAQGRAPGAGSPWGSPTPGSAFSVGVDASMAYARMSATSDVYVWSDGNHIHCTWCRLAAPGGSDTFVSTEYPPMIAHLEEHRARGHKVPEHVMASLNREAAISPLVAVVSAFEEDDS